MKKKYLVTGLFLVSILSFSSERESIKNLNQLYSEKKYREAILGAKEFLEKYPKSDQSFVVETRLAKTYYVRQDYENAIKTFDRILKKYQLTLDDISEFNYYIAKSYLMLEEPEKANETIAKIDKKSLYYERAFYDSGIIYLDRDEYEKAFEIFKKLGTTGTQFKNPSIFNMALTSYNDGKYELVIDILNSYVPLKDKNRDDSAILFLYGTSYYRLDKTNEAIKYFEELSKNHPKTAYGKKARIILIEIYANLKNHAKVQELERLVRGTPEESEAYVTLGDYYVSMGDYPKAIEYYQKANIETNPRALYGYAYSLYNMDRISEALPQFIKLEKTSYYNQAIYYKFAIYYKQKEYNKIIENKDEVKRIVVTQQDNDNINIIIANAAYELNNLKLAREYFSKLNLHSPSKDNLYRVITMSGVLNRAQDVEKRVAEYNKLYPSDTEYRKKIYIAAGEALYNNEKGAEAEKLYKEYLSKNNDEDILNALVNVLVNEKKYSELNVYLDKKGDTVETKYLRAVSSTGLGKHEEAEKYYQEVLKEISNSSNSPWYLKTIHNQLNNYFLWGKYSLVTAKGEEYIKIPDAPEKENIIEKIAISYYRLDNYDKSREYFGKLLSNTEKTESVKFQIADTYFAQNNMSRAKEIYTEVYTTSKDEKNKEIALYSLTKVATKKGDLNDLKKYSDEFLKKYPNSQYKENLLTSYSQAAGGIKNNNDIIKTYQTIYNSSKEDYVRQDALEKLAQASIDIKKYTDAEKYAKEIKNSTKRAYLLAQIYEKTGKKDSAAKQYEVLVALPEYKESSAINLARYWSEKKSYKKARDYYVEVVNLSKSSYKDLAYFEIAQLDEKTGDKNKAKSNYSAVYKNYPTSKYAEESRLKVAQLTEATSENEALKIYMEIAKNSKNKSYKIFALEKIVYSSLRAKNMEIAKKYYNELKKIDAESAKKYEEFFKGGA